MNNDRISTRYIGAFTDFIINIFVVLFSYKISYISDFFKLTETSVIIGALLVFVASFVYFLFDVYSIKPYEKLISLLVKIFIAQLFVITISMVAVALFAANVASNYIFAIAICGISYACIAVKKIIVTKILHRIRMNKKNQKNILIVGNSNGALEYVNQINDNKHYGYKIIGCVCDSENPKLNKLGGMDELDMIIKVYKPQEIVLALHAHEDKKTLDILSICDQNGIRTSIVPVEYKYFKSKSQIDMVGNIPVINTRAIPLDNMANAALKRIMDIIISLMVIILTFPIMIIAFIGVKLSSKGPAIFKQKRVGKNNKEFTMYKFRSMKVNDQESTGWTTSDDPRKTKFGTFMRKTGIDELPQFFNVLFGSMSIVGPRPELPVHVEKYKKEIPLYMVKHQVKPGITGLAQIYGYRGDTSIEKRIDLDIKYIEEWTLFNDIKILIATPFKMFNRNEKYIK
ncbi:MAG: undecaprenyl-phosphate glucose phosphotransferase [Clostridia bacterium]|nr:undecaprenyl-phosphate glucose phosphotransferase [Clostridia bacterium]